MGVKCILLYQLPKGVTPVREDVERLVAALTQQLYCVPETSARSLKESAAAADKALEATVNVYKQQQVSDVSLVKEPRSLQDFWLFKLHREAPSKAYVLIKTFAHALPYRVTEAEPSIRTFLEKRLDYKMRNCIYIQSQSWFMGDKNSDVTIKLLTHGSQSPKVVALEVTYQPACILDSAAPLLQELADKIIATVGPPQGSGPGQAGTLVALAPKYYKPKSSDPNDPNEPSPLFGPSHIVELYSELISEGMGGR